MTQNTVDTEIVQDSTTGLWYRPGGLDKAIFGDCRVYKLVPLSPTDVVLDIGAHIGIASAQFLEAPCWYVVSVEPEPRNLHLLRTNLASYGERAIIVEGAVRERFDVPTTLYINSGRNLSTHTTTPTNGRNAISVPSIGIDWLLKTYSPTVVKIDIEGGEYELLPALQCLPTTVRAVMMELHLTRRDWRNVQAPKVVAAMRAQGFQTLREPNIGEKNWTTMAVWAR